MIKKLVLLLAIGLVGCGGGSDDSTSKAPPSSPTTIQAKVNNNEVILSWHPVTGAESYNIYYSSDAKLSIKNYSVYPNNGYLINVSSGHVIKNLPIAPVYYFVVTAIAKGLESQQGQLIAAVTRYDIVGDGDVVRDKVTNLEWQRCTLGLVWNKSVSECMGTANLYTTNQMLTFVAPNADGWQLPSSAEMNSLKFCDGHNPPFFSEQIPSSCLGQVNLITPAIVQWAFPNTQTVRFYHTSTIYENDGVKTYCSTSGNCASDSTGTERLPNYIRLVRRIKT